MQEIKNFTSKQFKDNGIDYVNRLLDEGLITRHDLTGVTISDATKILSISDYDAIHNLLKYKVWPFADILKLDADQLLGLKPVVLLVQDMIMNGELDSAKLSDCGNCRTVTLVVKEITELILNGYLTVHEAITLSKPAVRCLAAAKMQELFKIGRISLANIVPIDDEQCRNVQKEPVYEWLLNNATTFTTAMKFARKEVYKFRTPKVPQLVDEGLIPFDYAINLSYQSIANLESPTLMGLYRKGFLLLSDVIKFDFQQHMNFETALLRHYFMMGNVSKDELLGMQEWQRVNFDNEIVISYLAQRFLSIMQVESLTGDQIDRIDWLYNSILGFFVGGDIHGEYCLHQESFGSYFLLQLIVFPNIVFSRIEFMLSANPIFFIFIVLGVLAGFCYDRIMHAQVEIDELQGEELQERQPIMARMLAAEKRIEELGKEDPEFKFDSKTRCSICWEDFVGVQNPRPLHFPQPAQQQHELMHFNCYRESVNQRGGLFHLFTNRDLEDPKNVQIYRTSTVNSH